MKTLTEYPKTIDGVMFPFRVLIKTHNHSFKYVEYYNIKPAFLPNEEVWTKQIINGQTIYCREVTQ